MVDFFFLKERVEHILNRLGIVHFKAEEISNYGYSQGLMYTSKKKRLVCFGQLDKKLTKEFGIKSNVYAADFNWDLILELIVFNKTKYKEVNRFPSVRRDLSLLIDESITFSELEKIARKTDNTILKSINLFDVYEGDKLPKGKKSYALSFIMMDSEKTLTDKDVDQVMNKLIDSFKAKVGAEIR